MTAAAITFRPLEAEIDGVLGWHDGFTLNVVEHSTNDGMVFNHERIHGTLINTTIDGKLLTLLRIAGPRLDNLDHVEELHETSRYLFEGSRFAHESAATYLGIMTLDTEPERATALHRLPDQYRAYYEFMSAIVDAQCGSSFLCYVIAQAVAHFWFSSSALIELAGSGYRGTVVMHENFLPDWRAHSSAHWLTHTGVTEAISASIKAILENEQLRNLGLFFDASNIEKALNDESWWISQRSSVTTFVEEIISETSFRYFLTHSDLISAPERMIRNTDLSDQLLKPLYERAGIQLISINEMKGNTLLSGHSPASAFREFFVIARTISHIQPRIDVSPHSATKFLGLPDLKAFTQRKGVVDILFPEPETPSSTQINEFVTPLNAPAPHNRVVFASYHRCSAQVASMLLSQIMKNQAREELDMRIDCIVVHADSESAFDGYKSLSRFLDEQANSSQLDGFAPPLTAQHTELISEQNLYIYARDHWDRVVGTHEQNRPATYVGTIPVNITGRELFMLNVARIEGFHGTLLKAYPSHTMPIIEAYYHSCFQQGTLHRLEEQNFGPDLLKASRRALAAITMAWHQL